jgi:hypothetical protein
MHKELLVQPCLKVALWLLAPLELLVGLWLLVQDAHRNLR